MRQALAALAAAASSVALHGTLSLLAAATGALPQHLVSFDRRGRLRHAAAYLLQALALVAAYLIVGDGLPGGSGIVRGVSFGALVVLLSVCLPLVPLVLVFREPLTRRQAWESLAGGIVVGFPVGVVFVLVWEQLG